MEENLEFRNLREDELSQWYDFVDSVFLRTPREYFVRHWEKDPFKDLSGIFVCVSHKQIVSSVRVYHRKIFISGHIFQMGGIGEVSTSKDYRRRGLATKLLKMAISYMEEKHMPVSALGGDEKIYSELGWNFFSLEIFLHEIKPSRQKSNFVTTKNQLQGLNGT